MLEDPAVEAPDDVFTLSKTIEQASDTPEYVTIEFNQGTPVAVNDRALSPVDLLTTLNDLGAKHGIGQIDMVENRLVGIKSRGVYETPGGTILYDAHRILEQLVHDRDTSLLKQNYRWNTLNWCMMGVGFVRLVRRWMHLLTKLNSW